MCCTWCAADQLAVQGATVHGLLERGSGQSHRTLASTYNTHGMHNIVASETRQSTL